MPGVYFNCHPGRPIDILNSIEKKMSFKIRITKWGMGVVIYENTTVSLN